MVSRRKTTPQLSNEPGAARYVQPPGTPGGKGVRGRLCAACKPSGSPLAARAKGGCNCIFPLNKPNITNMFCRTCAKELPESAVACIQCGCPPHIGNKFCQGCGAETMEQAVICVKCGSSLKGGKAHLAHGNRPIDKTALCILTFCLGGLGAHKFYTGNWGWGLIYLVFFWTFIPAFVSFIEFVIYLTKDEATLQSSCERIRGQPFGFLV